MLFQFHQSFNLPSSPRKNPGQLHHHPPRPSRRPSERGGGLLGSCRQAPQPGAGSNRKEAAAGGHHLCPLHLGCQHEEVQAAHAGGRHREDHHQLDGASSRLLRASGGVLCFNSNFINFNYVDRSWLAHSTRCPSTSLPSACYRINDPFMCGTQGQDHVFLTSDAKEICNALAESFRTVTGCPLEITESVRRSSLWECMHTFFRFLQIYFGNVTYIMWLSTWSGESMS